MDTLPPQENLAHKVIRSKQLCKFLTTLELTLIKNCLSNYSFCARS